MTTLTTKTDTTKTTAAQLRALFAAAGGHRLTAREAKTADAAGLLIREPRTGWCLITERGRRALRDAGLE